MSGTKAGDYFLACFVRRGVLSSLAMGFTVGTGFSRSPSPLLGPLAGRGR